MLDASHVFPRDMRSPPPVAVGGEGCWLIGADGRRWLDASGGAAVSCLGHGDRQVIEAIKEQAEALAFAHTGFLTSAPAEALADLLAVMAPPGLSRCYFVAGGSEAIEAAIKLARQWFVERGEHARSRIVARRMSYHGNTLGALGAGGNPARRRAYEPLLTPTSHIMDCHAYRGRESGETPEAYGERAAQALEDEILRLGPETVMAFIAETVVGATLGAATPAPGYFKRIREICDRYGVLLILDEVMCGMGRCGAPFTFAQEGVVPDIACIAKGLGGGYQPIGAMMCSDAIYDGIAHGSGAFAHGHTYLGHPIACAAALAVQTAIRERHLLQKVEARGAQLMARLREAFDEHPHVGDIRGRGLFQTIELVEDRETKRPFPASRGLHKAIKSEAFARGLICYPNGGSVDGTNGDHVLLAPPFIASEEEIDMIVSRLAAAVDAALEVTG